MEILKENTLDLDFIDQVEVSVTRILDDVGIVYHFHMFSKEMKQISKRNSTRNNH